MCDGLVSINLCLSARRQPGGEIRKLLSRADNHCKTFNGDAMLFDFMTEDITAKYVGVHDFVLEQFNTESRSKAMYLWSFCKMRQTVDD